MNEECRPPGLTRRTFLSRTGMAGAGLLAVPGLLEACAAGGPQQTTTSTASSKMEARSFTFAYDQPHETAYGTLADSFEKKLKELTGDKWKISQFPLAQLGTEPEMAQKVRTGDIDFVINSTANTATVVPQAGVFSLHFIFRDEAHLSKTVLDSNVNEVFKKMIKAGTTGATSLGLMTLGFRNMYSKSEVKGEADLRGKKIRVQATKTEDAFFSAYGAVPIHMPFGQVYTSLQTGVVQIAENGNDIYLKNKHYEVAPVLSATEHEANNNHLWVSDKAWNSFTPEQRKFVQQAADYARPIAVKAALANNESAITSLKGLGARYVTGVDKKVWQSTATPIQDQQASELGSFATQLLAIVRNLK